MHDPAMKVKETYPLKADRIRANDAYEKEKISFPTLPLLFIGEISFHRLWKTSRRSQKGARWGQNLASCVAKKRKRRGNEDPHAAKEPTTTKNAPFLHMNG